MIRITSKVDGFRRAGVAHAATPTEHQDDRFTEEQLRQITAEPMLVVERIKDDASQAPLIALVSDGTAPSAVDLSVAKATPATPLKTPGKSTAKPKPKR